MRSLPHSWNKTWTKLGFQRRPRRCAKRAYDGRHTRLGVEALEDRRMLAILVNSPTDDGTGGTTLREAIVTANGAPGADEITFAPGITSITLTQGEIEITGDLTITGPGAGSLTIHGMPNDPGTPGDGSRIFSITDASFGATPPSVVLEGLTLTDGDLGFSGIAGGGNGGAIYSQGLLTVRHSVITGNSAPFQWGGAIYAHTIGIGTSARTVATIEDSTISNNNATYGGGLYLKLDHSTIDYAESALISRSTISGNDVNWDGGGVYARLGDSATLTLDDVTLSDNIAGRSGGGLFAMQFGGNLAIAGSHLTGNSAAASGSGSGSQGAGGGGGGIFAQLNNSGSLSIDQTEVSSNEATFGNGGGVLTKAFFDGVNPFPSAKSVTISNSLISDNSAADRGGGLFTFNREGTEALVENSRVTGNTSEVNGGGVYAYVWDSSFNVYKPRFVMSGSTLDHNNTQQRGGGIFFCSKYFGDFVAVNSTFSQNSTLDAGSGQGGGLFLAHYPLSNESLDARLNNVTVTQNHSADGGGLHSMNFDNVRTQVNNSIVSANTNHDGTAPNNLVGRFDIDNSQYNLVGSGSNVLDLDGVSATLDSTNISSDSPGLGPLAFNGGPTPTHALVAGSLAADRGSNALAVNPLTGAPLKTDQRGAHGSVNRPVDLPSVGGAGEGVNGFSVDIGAVECDPDFLPGDYNVNGIVDAADYVVWRHALGTTVTPFYGADGSGNGIVDEADYQIWRANFGNMPADDCGIMVELPGDYNDDNIVDAADYVVWRFYLGQNVTLPNDTTPGTVTQADYDVWRAHFGATVTPPAAAAVAGDYNRDATVDSEDYDLWLSSFGSESNLYADGSGNGIVDMSDLAVWTEARGVTTNEILVGDYNGNGVVEQLDYDLWRSTFGSTTQLAADGNGNGVIDAGDYVVWRANLGATNAAAWPLVLNGASGMPVEAPSAAPKVLDVTLAGSSSAHTPFAFSSVDGSGNQLRSVPVAGVDTLSVKFSEEVFVPSNALTLAGLQGQTIPAVSQFIYDVAAQTATWRFASALATGQYLVRVADSIIDLDWDKLDGEFTNPWSLTEAAGYASTFPSGDGQAGGEFRLRTTILPSDYSGDNFTDTSDYIVWSIHNGQTGATSTRYGDGNGDGVVNSADYALWSSQYGTNYVNWPSVEPAMILVSTLADESDGNYTLGDLSLREALVLAAGQAGQDTIVFAPSLYAGGAATITLTYDGPDPGTVPEPLSISSEVIVKGPGANLLSISGGGQTRVIDSYSGYNLVVEALTITGGNSAWGGAIYSAYGDLTLRATRITGNTAAYYGGGVYSYGALRIIDSEISGNVVTQPWGSGGGVFNRRTSYNGDDLEIINSTLSGNQATGANGRGGGLFAYFYGPTGGNAHARIVNSTITGNSASSGGGLYATPYYNGGAPFVKADNSIIAGNFNASQTTANDVAGANLDPASSHNLLGSGGSGGLSGGTNGNIVLAAGQNAGLSPLGNYGGPTKTHTLLVGSPAIDAGSLALALGTDGKPLVKDQRGRNRVVYAVDIGAVEREILGDYSGDGTVDAGDYIVWRASENSTTNLWADGDGSGKVDANDYEVWRNHFGNTNGPGLSASYGIYVVSTHLDESDANYTFGDLSLREALSLAASHTGHDQIVFRHNLASPTITLAAGLGQLVVNSNVTIVGRGADQFTVSGGGAVRVFNIPSGVTTEIRDLKITGGNGDNSYGGGIYSQGNLTLNRVALENNHSWVYGGGIYAVGGSLAVSNSTIAGNVGYYIGGGAYLSGVAATFTNSTISANSTGYYGGGIYASGVSLQLNHVTMTQNRVDYGSGGGLYVGTGSTVLRHTIIADNFRGPGTSSENDVVGFVDAALSRFNLIGAGGSGGLTNGVNGNRVNVANPGLATLGYYGGPTRTHALLNGSQAIDTGDASITGAPSSDQRGKSRIADGDDDFTARIDIGAFELAADEYFGSI